MPDSCRDVPFRRNIQRGQALRRVKQGPNRNQLIRVAVNSRTGGRLRISAAKAPDLIANSTRGRDRTCAEGRIQAGHGIGHVWAIEPIDPGPKPSATALVS